MPLPLLIRRVAQLWIGYAAVYGGILAFLLWHPYFSSAFAEQVMANLQYIYFAWLALSPIVFFCALRAGGKAAFRGDRLVLIMQYFFASARGGAPRPEWPIVRTGLLSFVVKAFFFPLMLGFFLEHWQTLIPELQRAAASGQFFIALWDNLHFILFQSIFFIDTIIFGAAYLFESKHLGNEIKSVDPNPSGWLVALICYPPFTAGISQLLPLYKSEAWIESAFVLDLFNWLMLVVFVIYLWASIALGPRAGNLVNRGIVATGPYRFVRHPAYFAKNLAWWFEFLPYLTPVTFFGLLGWNVIYIFRGLTEERHLLADPDYQKYAKQVRWRFIPGLW